jgi:hypothetical protein
MGFAGGTGTRQKSALEFSEIASLNWSGFVLSTAHVHGKD